MLYLSYNRPLQEELSREGAMMIMFRLHFAYLKMIIRGSTSGVEFEDKENLGHELEKL